MRYFTAEVFSGKLMELEEEKYTERRQKVYTFMKIPREFEKVNCKLKQHMIMSLGKNLCFHGTSLYLVVKKICQTSRKA